MHITIIAGARPNFMKIAPIIHAIHAAQKEQKSIHYRLVHTGQHHDPGMSDHFFTQLGIPMPDANLEAHGGTQAEQTGVIMTRFERELQENPTDLVLVVGDVTSTMACTITAKKMCTPVAHVEAGIRSGDMTMPEEINRVVTDSICDHFFTTSEIANANLRNTGIPENRIHFVGNTMIDTLYQNIHRLQRPDFWASYELEPQAYLLLTLHRPANVDDPSHLQRLLEAILEGTQQKIIFPVHPRTRKSLENIDFGHERLLQVSPMSYLEFMYLIQHSKGVITDSGGITEETTVLGIPCVTLRNSTERPETILMGTNELAGTDPSALAPYLEKMSSGSWKKGNIPPLWDGHTAERIIHTLLSLNTVPNRTYAYAK